MIVSAYYIVLPYGRPLKVRVTSTPVSSFTFRCNTSVSHYWEQILYHKMSSVANRTNSAVIFKHSAFYPVFNFYPTDAQLYSSKIMLKFTLKFTLKCILM